MKIDISTQNFELTKSVKKQIEKKFEKLNKFDSTFYLKINISLTKRFTAVTAILTGKETYRASEDSYQNVHKAINKVYAKIKKPIRRNRKGIWSRLLKKIKNK